MTNPTKINIIGKTGNPKRPNPKPLIPRINSKNTKPMAKMVKPMLTSLRPDYQKLAETAIGCLQSRLAVPNSPGREFVFAPDLIVRESSARTSPRARRGNAG